MQPVNNKDFVDKLNNRLTFDFLRLSQKKTDLFLNY